MNNTSHDFSIKHAVCLEKQLQTTADDLYGGGNNNYPATGDQLPVEANAEFQTGTEYYTDASMNGTQFNGDKRKTAELPTVSSLNIKGYTQGLERLMLAAMGYSKPSGAVNQSGDFYKHSFIIPQHGKNQRKYTQPETYGISGYNENDVINTYLCVSQCLGPYVRHARNVVIRDFEISCSAKNPLQITMSGPAERINIDQSKESSASWSLPSGAFEQWFQLSDFEFYLWEPGQSQNKISITEFIAKVSNGISDDNVPTGTSNNGLSRAEPMPTGKSTVTLEATVYLHNKTDYEDWQRDSKVLQCKIEGQRDGYGFTLLFPRLFITLAEPNFDNAGSVKITMETALPSEGELLTDCGMQWAEPSVMGLVITSKESRNTMRWS